MPIGVPRIIYCWGEEVPAQWTDIYNFIFRRRMVFLMQYLDDELCNQICGLLINIHMEDRSKELEKKEMEKSGLFKSPPKQKKGENASPQASYSSSNLEKKRNSSGSPLRGDGLSPALNMANARPQKLIEDLMISEQDLGIDENYSLERYTLQKMTLEWLNWNAQFFDYSEEPYLFYLAEILSKDFSGKGSEGRLYYEDLNLESSSFSSSEPFSSSESSTSKNFGIDTSENASLPFEFSRLMMLFKNVAISNGSPTELRANSSETSHPKLAKFDPKLFDVEAETLNPFDVYSPFRLLANLVSPEYREFLPFLNKRTSSEVDKRSDKSVSSLPKSPIWEPNRRFAEASQSKIGCQISDLAPALPFPLSTDLHKVGKGEQILGISEKDERRLNPVSHLITDLSQKNLFEGLEQPQTQLRFSEKAFTQKQLRREYKKTSMNIREATPFSNQRAGMNYASSQKRRPSAKPASYLAGGSLPSEESYMEFRDYYRKQTESALQEEEAKKVFMIINSFGGSVGNGITVHDALQFIKAGSLTLALGVAASAASLALAGGTIGERYVTEGCHTMIHQPEGGLQGQASDIWIDSQEIMKIRLDVAEIYSLSTYRPRHKILRDLDRDFYLTAQETVFYGLADEIATNEVMHEIISMTSQVWDYHDTQQMKLLERRESANSAADTQTQN